jgi:hypothetical protein
MNIQLDFFCTSATGSKDCPVRIAPLDLQGHDNPQRRWLPTARYIEHLVFERFNKKSSAADDAAQTGEAAQRLVVLLTDTRHLTEPQTLELLTQGGAESLRYASPGKDEGRTDWEERMYPILTVGAEDFSDLYAEDAGEVPPERRYLYKIGFDHRVKFWDSSIWHRYVPLNEDFEKNLRAVLRQTVQHFQNGLYLSYASLATLEFQTRAMLQSYICEAKGGGHGEVVTPFKFHSETFMARKADALFEALKTVGYGEKKLFHTVRWRLLLVDDYAYKPLRSRLGDAQGTTRLISKRNLIVNLLNEGMAGFSPLPNDASEDASAGCVFSVADVEEENHSFVAGGLSALRKRMYDVVLLDYLLGEDQGGYRGGREYGYDFLHQLEQQIRDDEQPDRPIHKGPMGRFWVFPISSFPFAFADKLRQLGMDGYADHWHLSGGGDPITSPALFRYNFLQFVKQQVDECCLSEGALSGFFQRFSSIRDKNAWRGALELGLQRIRLKQEMLRSDMEGRSVFSETMAEFVAQDPEMMRQMNRLTRFLGQLDTVSYFKLLDEIAEIVGLTSNQRAELYNKCEQTFFAEERKCKEQIQKHSEEKPVFELTGTKLRWLPREIKGLAGLTRLRLSNNLLQELPKEIGQLTQLKDLDLSENRLDKQKLPDELFALPELWRLNLRDNPELPDNWQKEHVGRESLERLAADVAAKNQPQPTANSQ